MVSQRLKVLKISVVALCVFSLAFADLGSVAQAQCRNGSCSIRSAGRRLFPRAAARRDEARARSAQAQMEAEAHHAMMADIVDGCYGSTRSGSSPVCIIKSRSSSSGCYGRTGSLLPMRGRYSSRSPIILMPRNNAAGSCPCDCDNCPCNDNQGKAAEESPLSVTKRFRSPLAVVKHLEEKRSPIVVTRELPGLNAVASL